MPPAQSFESREVAIGRHEFTTVLDRERPSERGRNLEDTRVGDEPQHAREHTLGHRERLARSDHTVEAFRFFMI